MANLLLLSALALGAYAQLIPPLRPPGTSSPTPQPLNERVDPARKALESGAPSSPVDRPPDRPGKPDTAAPSEKAAGGGSSPSVDPKAAKKEEPKAPRPDPGPRLGLYATLVTTKGSIEFKLLENEAPLTVRNFVDLCLGRKLWRHPDTLARTQRPLIPGTIFHRVMPKFMIQAGDPSGTGAGDVGFVVKDEFVPSLKFDRPGRVAMANLGPGTASSQFFITEVPTPWLDGKYSIFGDVVSGYEVVEEIARVPTDPATNAPKTPVKILKVTFKREGAVPPNAPEGPAPRTPARPTPPTKKK